jgi:hypothetical protein
MNLFRPLLAACMAGLIATPALADRPRDQDRAFRAKTEGQALTYPQIKERIRPQMNGATPLGPEIRGSNYRLKFIRNGRLIWVDVDAATGRIVDRSDR